MLNQELKSCEDRIYLIKNKIEKVKYMYIFFSFLFLLAFTGILYYFKSILKKYLADRKSK